MPESTGSTDARGVAEGIPPKSSRGTQQGTPTENDGMTSNRLGGERVNPKSPSVQTKSNDELLLLVELFPKFLPYRKFVQTIVFIEEKPRVYKMGAEKDTISEYSDITYRQYFDKYRESLKNFPCIDEDVKFTLKWDFDNPRLGKYYICDVNKNDMDWVAELYLYSSKKEMKSCWVMASYNFTLHVETGIKITEEKYNKLDEKNRFFFKEKGKPMTFFKKKEEGNYPMADKVTGGDNGRYFLFPFNKSVALPKDYNILSDNRADNEGIIVEMNGKVSIEGIVYS
jgi:hypothetical protein